MTAPASTLNSAAMTSSACRECGGAAGHDLVVDEPEGGVEKGQAEEDEPGDDHDRDRGRPPPR